MYKGSEIIKKPIIARSTGVVIDRVKDAIFDTQEKNLLALLIDEPKLFGKAKIVPFYKIRAIGADAITVEDISAVKTADEDPPTARILSQNYTVQGTRLITDDGRQLGQITDMYFDEKTGRLEGYEISTGMLQDAYSGKGFLPASSNVQVGKDVAMVPSQAAQLFERPDGGIKQTMKETGQKVKDVKNATAEKMKSAQPQQTGDTVTQQGKQWLDKTAAYMQKDMQETESGLKQAWEKIKGKTEETRIAKALGRPVTRVIFDENDQIILNTGDLITHEALERARKAGALEILLSSVYTRKPDFPDEKLRADERPQDIDLG